MSSDGEGEERRAFEADPRALCRYDGKCYQRNPLHRAKYKHTPRQAEARNEEDREAVATGRKRKSDDREDEEEAGNASAAYPAKLRRTSVTPVRGSHDLSPSPDGDSLLAGSGERLGNPASPGDEARAKGDGAGEPPSAADAKARIADLFLVEMPEDFYQLYELCSGLSRDDPRNALKSARLRLVGPYDVLSGSLGDAGGDGKKYLRHWRYYYDPPEFQTVVRVDDKDGSHFGYWRDEPSEKPVFVARNRANVESTIEPVAENLLAAVEAHVQGELRTANPFERAGLSRLHRTLRDFCRERGIGLERSTDGTRSREKRVVARTFHRAGVVVPYDRRTRLGYRDLAVTDGELRKILKRIEEAATPEERKAPMARLEEVVRLAVIAADECDFGTCLELGHDLFASGCSHVQHVALQMLRVAYTQLRRPQFLEIAEAHLADRRKGGDLSVT